MTLHAHRRFFRNAPMDTGPEPIILTMYRSMA